MKHIKTSLSAVVIFFVLSSFSAQDNTIIGTWKATELENSTIEIYEEKSGDLYGKIKDSDEKSWVGKIILKQVQYDTEEKVWKGKIYSLRRNMTIDATISLENNQKLKLVGTKFFMTKTFYWTR